MDPHRRDRLSNMLSFDLEHWHSATLIRPEVADPVDRLHESLDIVLDLLDRYGVSTTFFVVGEVAEQYPGLVRRVDEARHELASHGHTHRPLSDLTPTTFEDELTRSAEAIREVTGRSPVGFRAPNFSIDRDTAWAFRVLESSDYEYDSSLFPVKTPMYGVSGAPLRPYRVSPDTPFERSGAGDTASDVVEFPLAVSESPMRVPFAGGFYARVLPVTLIERGIRRLNERGIPANLYFHPWEFNPHVRTDIDGPHKRFISFHGIERLQAKLERLLETFEFEPLRAVYDDVRPRDDNVERLQT